MLKGPKKQKTIPKAQAQNKKKIEYQCGWHDPHVRSTFDYQKPGSRDSKQPDAKYQSDQHEYPTDKELYPH